VNVSVPTPALGSGSIQLSDLSVCQSDRQIEAVQCICCGITRITGIYSDVYQIYGSIDSYALNRYTGMYENNFSEDSSLVECYTLSNAK
jgi:hypothetical protein